MKKILGLDLGPNSIGWCSLNCEEKTSINFKNQETVSLKPLSISTAGVRIIPTDAGIMGDFESGNALTTTAARLRTNARGVRRLRERFLLRRSRLHRVLHILGFLPQHYAEAIDFERHFGQFKEENDTKLAYRVEPSGKYQFIFMDSYSEMLADFKTAHPEITKKIPYDWTIYYLRKKALSKKISREELAWIILNFNQKRGYYQLRGEDEDLDKVEEYAQLLVIAVEDSGEKRGDNVWYNVKLENGDVYRRQSRVPLDSWVGQRKDFIITTTESKSGEIKRSYRAPKEDDWTLKKKKTELVLADSGKQVGEYIYDSILAVPDRKIRGGLIQTIERKFYRKELTAILEAQAQFHPELKDNNLYLTAITDLYRSNDEYRNHVAGSNFTYLIVDDIIFYQRPLRSQKGLIDECQYEYRIFKKDGAFQRQYLKCAPKSHPVFQEFRLWQFLRDLRILRLSDGADVTGEFLNEDSYVNLFSKLREKDEVNQTSLLSLIGIKTKKNSDPEYSWNYGDSTRPMCPTHAELAKRLKEVGLDESFLANVEVDGTKPKQGMTEPDKVSFEERLWHILYSVTTKEESSKALHSFAVKHSSFITDIDAFVAALMKIKPFDSDYGSYSLKAIRKLLPLMRIGKMWNENDIDSGTLARINKIIDGEFDASIPDNVRQQFNKILGENPSLQTFRGLPLWLACYVVYGRHAESSDAAKWNSPDDINNYLFDFRQHSLRNPVVEQVVTETLRVVRDIWIKEGRIDEIHIELARDLKNNAEKRKSMTEQNRRNEATNSRIRALLAEMRSYNANPNSGKHLDKLKLYEEAALCDKRNLPDDISKISQEAQPSAADLQRYRLWLDQRYCSPYTGRPIPLSKLFTEEYQVDHIIPQALYYDDSLSNKVICESSVNSHKGNNLPIAFFRNKENHSFDDGNGGTVTVFTWEDYQNFVNANFKFNPVKRKKLLLEEIPESFIERQMNDTRYISRLITGLLSNIVRDADELEATSKHVIPVTGKITTKLKEDWGLNDVWNEIISPRFIRLNGLYPDLNFGSIGEDAKFHPSMPDSLGEKLNKKRIDHRHHCMDAIVIACAVRSIINFLNNENANTSNLKMRENWRDTLCTKSSSGKHLFIKPWQGFTADAKHALMNVVVSFKQNLRLVSRAHNQYTVIESGKKVKKSQVGVNWAVRKPLHKETVFAHVNIQGTKSVKLSEAVKNYNSIVDKPLRKQIRMMVEQNHFTEKQVMAYFKNIGYVFNHKDISKVEIRYFTDNTSEPLAAVRKPINSSFTVKNVNSVTDSGIRKILLAHLAKWGGKADEAFSPEGIDDLNKNIKELNGGVDHKPIFKVRLSENLGSKFNVGERGNRKEKFVEAEKGTNLYYAVYETPDHKRKAFSIPLNVAIECVLQGRNIAEDTTSDGNRLLFVLSPNDLVYLPTPEQLDRKIDINDVLENKDRIFKFVSSSKLQSFFIPYSISSSILDKKEYGPLNKIESFDGHTIKETCIKLNIDRLGNITL
jgi:CRISPR-associated endonuclease Csn1